MLEQRIPKLLNLVDPCELFVSNQLSAERAFDPRKRNGGKSILLPVLYSTLMLNYELALFRTLFRVLMHAYSMKFYMKCTFLFSPVSAE